MKSRNQKSQQNVNRSNVHLVWSSERGFEAKPARVAISFVQMQRRYGYRAGIAAFDVQLEASQIKPDGTIVAGTKLTAIAPNGIKVKC